MKTKFNKSVGIAPRAIYDVVSIHKALFDKEEKVYSFFQTANGEKKRHKLCVGERPGSNPGSGDLKWSVLPSKLLAQSSAFKTMLQFQYCTSAHGGGLLNINPQHLTTFWPMSRR
jgi:hypothetical protein